MWHEQLLGLHASVCTLTNSSLISLPIFSAVPIVVAIIAEQAWGWNALRSFSSTGVDLLAGC